MEKIRIFKHEESVGENLKEGTLFTQRQIIKGRFLTAGERGINVSEMIAWIERTCS